jgi:hypothetical protein
MSTSIARTVRQLASTGRMSSLAIPVLGDAADHIDTLTAERDALKARLEEKELARVGRSSDFQQQATASENSLTHPLVVVGRVRKCEIGNFTVVAERGEGGDYGAPVAYVADSLHAVDIVRACNSHDALLAALKLAVGDGELVCSGSTYDAMCAAIAKCEGREVTHG